MTRLSRSLLFVPGNRPDRFEKALACGADSVIIDLEDAVAPQAKDEARGTLTAWLAKGAGGRRGASAEARGNREPAVLVRLNGADTPWFEQDLALCGQPGVAGVMLPKAEGGATLAALREAGARVLLPLVESAAGFTALGAIAAAPGVERLAFGSIDFQVDLGMRDAREEELLYFRSQLVLASRLAGLAPPVDGVSTAIDDAASLEDDTLRARRLGFGGKLCIHPRQVAPIHRALRPSDEQLDWARRVLAADAASPGAAQLDGRMVDRPVVLQAQRLLRLGRG
ncbi:MAG: HpcH/HpaI aldolase/citrate lyase family protein [Gammaproteobacteria bacterium]